MSVERAGFGEQLTGRWAMVRAAAAASMTVVLCVPSAFAGEVRQLEAEPDDNVDAAVAWTRAFVDEAASRWCAGCVLPRPR